jgi:hypothetical protein
MQPSPPCRCPDQRPCGCRPYYGQPRWRDDAADYGHGRRKVQSRCRMGHTLSPTGESDPAIWGYGNRICLACQAARRGGELPEVIAAA